MQEMWVQSLGWEDPLEEGMATHPSIHAWRIPWTEEPGGQWLIGSQSWTQLKWLGMLYISLYGYIIFQCLKLKISRSKLALSLSKTSFLFWLLFWEKLLHLQARRRFSKSCLVAHSFNSVSSWWSILCLEYLSFISLVFRSWLTQEASEGQGGLLCCSACGYKKLDTNEQMNNNMVSFFLSDSFTHSFNIYQIVTMW